MNQGGVEDWLKQCDRLYPPKRQGMFQPKISVKTQILELNNKVPHTCLTCWWLQFRNGNSNRACVYDYYNSEKLPFKKLPEVCSWLCLGYRVDPEALNRQQGIMGIVM